MMFSVIIPCVTISETLITSCKRIVSLPGFCGEVIVLPNTASAQDLTDVGVEIQPTGKVAPGRKRDIGVERACFDWVVFFDDDACPDDNYFLCLVDGIKHDRTGSYFCGSAVSFDNESQAQRLSTICFESPLLGGSTGRYSARNSICVDDWPSSNFVVNRNSFNEIGGFDTDLWPGEDTVFCQKIADVGGRINYLPSCIVRHSRRDTMGKHILQVFKYSRIRGWLARQGGSLSSKLVYAIPTWSLLLFLLVSLITSFHASVIMLSSYCLITFISIVLVRRKKSVMQMILSTILLQLSHLSYAVGYFLGRFVDRSPWVVLRKDGLNCD